MPLRLFQVILAPLWTFLFVNEIPAVRTLIGGGVLLLAIVWLTVHPHKGDPPVGVASTTAPMPSAAYHAIEVDEKIELVAITA
jgi:hypothetical protein